MAISLSPFGKKPGGGAKHRLNIWDYLVFGGLAAIGALWGAEALGFIRPAVAVGLSGAVLAWAIACATPDGFGTYARLPVLMLMSIPMSRRGRMNRAATIHPVTELPADLPAEARVEFERYGQELERLGFRSGGMIRLAGMHYSVGREPSGEVILGCFEHAAARHGAAIILTVVRSPRFAAKVSLRFGEWVPGTGWIGTSNISTPALFPGNPSTRAISLAGVSDVGEMYRVQQAMLERFAPGHRLTGPAPRGWEIALREETERDFTFWTERGYLRPTGAPHEYRMSLWRGVLAYWVHLPPFKEMSQRRRERKSARMRADIGA